MVFRTVYSFLICCHTRWILFNLFIIKDIIQNVSNTEKFPFLVNYSRVEILTPKDEFMMDYFIEFPTVFEWLEKVFGQPVETEEQVNVLVVQWQKESRNAYRYIDKSIRKNTG